LRTLTIASLPRALLHYVQCLAVAEPERLEHAKALTNLSPSLAGHAFARLLFRSSPPSPPMMSDIILPFFDQRQSRRLAAALCAFSVSCAPRDIRLAALHHVAKAPIHFRVSALIPMLSHGEYGIRQVAATLISRHLDWYELGDIDHARLFIACGDRRSLIALAAKANPAVSTALLEACAATGVDLTFIGNALAQISDGKALWKLLEREWKSSLGWDKIATLLGAGAHEEALRIIRQWSHISMPLGPRHTALAALQKIQDPSLLYIARQARELLIEDANSCFEDVRRSALTHIQTIQYTQVSRDQALQLAAARGDVSYLQNIALEDCDKFVSRYYGLYKQHSRYLPPEVKTGQAIALLADVLRDFPAESAFSALAACSRVYDQDILDCLRLINVTPSLLLNYLSAHKYAATSIMPLLASLPDTPPPEMFFHVYPDLPREAQDSNCTYLIRYHDLAVPPSIVDRCISSALSRIHYFDSDETLAPRTTPAKDSADSNTPHGSIHHARADLPRSSRMLLKVFREQSISELFARAAAPFNTHVLKPAYIRAIGRLGGASAGEKLLDMLHSVRIPMRDSDFSDILRYSEARLTVGAIVNALGSLRYRRAADSICALWLADGGWKLDDECLRAFVLLKAPSSAVDELLSRFRKECKQHVLPEKSTHDDAYIVQRHVRLIYRALCSITSGCLDQLSQETIASLCSLPRSINVNIYRDNPDAGFYGGCTKDDLQSFTVCTDSIHRIVQVRHPMKPIE